MNELPRAFALRIGSRFERVGGGVGRVRPDVSGGRRVSGGAGGRGVAWPAALPSLWGGNPCSRRQRSGLPRRVRSRRQRSGVPSRVRSRRGQRQRRWPSVRRHEPQRQRHARQPPSAYHAPRPVPRQWQHGAARLPDRPPRTPPAPARRGRRPTAPAGGGLQGSSGSSSSSTTSGGQRLRNGTPLRPRPRLTKPRAPALTPSESPCTQPWAKRWP